MALYHLHIHSPISRSNGQSSLSTASYIEDRTLRDERIGKTFRFGSDKTLKHQTTERLGSQLADGTKIDTEILWNLAELKETRSNSRTARHMDIAFPREWTESQQREAAEELRRYLAERFKVASTVAIHREKRENPHAHLLFTTREAMPDGKGGISWGNKTRALDDRKQGPLEVEAIREAWCKICNRRGLKLDHRSYKRQGLEITPQLHLGAVALRMERKREHSDRIEVYLTRARITQAEKELEELKNGLIRERIHRERSHTFNHRHNDAILGRRLEGAQKSPRQDGREAGANRLGTSANDGRIKAGSERGSQQDRRSAGGSDRTSGSAGKESNLSKKINIRNSKSQNIIKIHNNKSEQLLKTIEKLLNEYINFTDQITIERLQNERNLARERDHGRGLDLY